jgi:hypothetical protein
VPIIADVEHKDAPRPQRKRRLDACVIQRAAIHIGRIPNAHRREDARNGRGGQHRWRDESTAKNHPLAVRDVGGDHA